MGIAAKSKARGTIQRRGAGQAKLTTAGVDTTPGDDISVAAVPQTPKTRGERGDVQAKLTAAQIAELREQNDLLQDRLRELSDELSFSVERKRVRERELREHSSRIAELNRAVKSLENTVRRLRNDLNRSEAQRVAMLQSFSWRVTRPYRALRKFLGVSYLRVAGPKNLRHPQSANFAADTASSPPSLAPVHVAAKLPPVERDVVKQLISASGLFDPNYYASHYADLLRDGRSPLDHYCADGWKDRRVDPTKWFVSAAYLAANPNLLEQQVNPLAHYIANLTPRRPVGYPHRTGRLAVYTAIAGGYDRLNEPASLPPDVDFYVFTDGDVPSGSAWTKLPFDYFHDDPTRRARFVKTHPHLYFGSYRWSVWMDANLGILVDPAELEGAFDPNIDIATWAHPLRTSVFDEASECIKRRKDDPRIIEVQMKRYRDEGFHDEVSLAETSVIVRQHREPKVVAAMNDWWREIDNGSKRDQLSLPYVLSKAQLRTTVLARPGVCMRSDHRFTYARHVN